MRILFWNTHRNVDINSYILDIVNQNEIDVLVLAEYMAEINELNDNLKQCKKRLFNWNTKGCERIHIWGIILMLRLENRINIFLFKL